MRGPGSCCQAHDTERIRWFWLVLTGGAISAHKYLFLPEEAILSVGSVGAELKNAKYEEVGRSSTAGIAFLWSLCSLFVD